MVAPVNNTGALSSLLRTQQTANVTQTTNRKIAQPIIERNAKNVQPKVIDLASAKSPPPANLPRGSIVDKLV